MEYRQFKADSVDDAITEATMQLGVPSTELDIVVVEEGSNGFLGIGKRQAVINARVREKDFSKKKSEKKAESKPKKDTEKKPDKPKFTMQVKDDQVKINTYDKNARVQKNKTDDRRNQNSQKPKNDKPRAAKPKNEKPAAEKTVTQTESRKDVSTSSVYSHSNFSDASVKNSAIKQQKPADEPVKPSVPKEEKPVVNPENIDEIMTETEKFLHDVLSAMNIETQVYMQFDKDHNDINIQLSGEEMGILIGKHGNTLDSLQYLTSLFANKKSTQYLRVHMDTENYRAKRQKTLENLARNIARKVKKTRREVYLEPMNPYERRIIHSALQNDRYVTTRSEGEEPYRKVVIYLKKNDRNSR